MLPLDNVEFGDQTTRALGQRRVGRLLGSVNHEDPFCQHSVTQSVLRRTLLFLLGVQANGETPGASGGLSPHVSGHEGPLRETAPRISVPWTSPQNHRGGVHWGGQEHHQIATTACTDANEGFDVFNEVYL